MQREECDTTPPDSFKDTKDSEVEDKGTDTDTSRSRKVVYHITNEVLASQLESADIVLLNKIDLVGEEGANTAERAVRALTPWAQVTGGEGEGEVR